MTEEEFREKMKEMGWSEEVITEHIRVHDEAMENGINIPFELDIIEAPLEDIVIQGINDALNELEEKRKMQKYSNLEGRLKRRKENSSSHKRINEIRKQLT